MKNTHLIYYDDNISYGSENYGYVKQFKNIIKGAFFAVNNTNSLNKLINKLSSSNVNGKFTLVTSGRAADKVIPLCQSIIDNVIIFCFYVDKYLPLKNKYSKLKNVVNNFTSIFSNLNDISINNDSNIIGNKMITLDEYKDKYINLHKKLAEFFNSNYYSMTYESSYKDNFNNFITSEVEDQYDRDNIIRWVNKVTQGTVKEFIEAYTGETPLCYSLNKWLRNCDEGQFNKIKYFAGPFSYALYKFAKDDHNNGVYYSKTFYRKMTIKLADFYLYKILEGELICYPAFTSTSEKDISKYNFPTSTAMDVNNLTSNDISVVLIIKYNCKSSSYPTPCVNASGYSVNAGEQEFIFPPFSFFKIVSIEEKEGKPDNPHIIRMTTPSKRSLIEFGIKNNKSINYDKDSDELYFN